MSDGFQVTITNLRQAAEQPGLLGVLARVADPRYRQGVRHRLTVILGLALCGGGRGAVVVHRDSRNGRRTRTSRPLRVLGVTGRCPRNQRVGGPCSAWTGCLR